MADEVHDVVEGDGFAVANVDALGDGPGFRKVRRALGVTAFGVNAIELPPDYETGRHYHDEQEELYFVHRGRIEMSFGDGSSHVLGPGLPLLLSAGLPLLLRILPHPVDHLGGEDEALDSARRRAARLRRRGA